MTRQRNKIPDSNRKFKSGRKIRYAVVGLGYISQVAVLPAFANAHENSELVALVSGDPRKLDKLGKKYRVKNKYSYDQYADCLKSGEVDAVFIALPNHMHRRYSESAAEAGIHVLCEKPMANTAAECESMVEAARRAKIKLMIAYRLHFEKANLSAVEAIRKGKIGEPRIFRSTFCMQVAPGNNRVQRDPGSGPLHDVGVYCINAARYLFRAEPQEVFAFGARSNDHRFAEVDEMIAALMRFPGDRLASFTCSFGALGGSSVEVLGTKGVLKMCPAFEFTDALKSEMTVNGKTTRTTFGNSDHFAAQFLYFSNCILKNIEPEPNGAEGLQDMRIIDALLESREQGRPIALSFPHTGPRPIMQQEIHKPAVKSPQLVRAKSPAK
jgi:predicted dehydrogenase